jgi:hypothetical protein
MPAPTLMRSVRSLALVLALMPVAAAADAMADLRANAHISERLLAAQIGDIIRRNCGSISPRYLYVYSEGRKLNQYALDLGFTQDQIDAYVSNPDEKARVLQEAKDYLAAHGVKDGDEASYCAVGRSEIAAKSIIGSLLFSW